MAHILLAEDDSSMRSFIEKTLLQAGHTVESCEDGKVALKRAEETQNPFDLLLTDIVMPGLDGIELSQKVSMGFPNVKVMFITGFAAVAMKNKDVNPEETKVLSKPFHLKQLVEQVDQLLEA